MDKEMKYEKKLYFEEWISYFNEYYSLLLSRYDRFKELRKAGYNIDADTYFDMLIVQLRSFMLDNLGNKVKGIRSYTFQNACELIGDEKATKKIDDLINTALIPGTSGCSECLIGYDCPKNISDCPVMQDLTLGEGIKIVTDKAICHYDNFYRENSHKWELIQLIKNILYDENEAINIDYIISTVKYIFHNGVKFDF